jgi:hypothetical protein
MPSDDFVMLSEASVAAVTLANSNHSRSKHHCLAKTFVPFDSRMTAVSSCGPACVPSVRRLRAIYRAA